MSEKQSRVERIGSRGKDATRGKAIRWQLTAALSGVPAQIYRVLEVAPDVPLSELGAILQVCVGREFLGQARLRFDNKAIVIDYDLDGDTKPDSERPLGEFIDLPGQRFRFEMSCDALWKFDVELTAVLNEVSGASLPQCVGGEGAMPDDWFGGNAEFAEFLVGTKNKSAPLSDFYKEMSDEISAAHRHYYTDFDREVVNDALRRLDEILD